PAGWGGHRVWLGPQGTWPTGWWPPPREWEESAAESVEMRDGVLTLLTPETGQGWPRVNRTYHWTHGSLVCGVDVLGDGSVPVQVLQIPQVPTTAVGRLDPRPDPAWPEGYAGLRVRDRRGTERLPVVPPPASIAGDRMTLHHTGLVEKLGFRTQAIV